MNEAEKDRIQYLYNVLRREHLTIGEGLALAGFMLSLMGLSANVRWFRSVAKMVLDALEDMSRDRITSELLSITLPEAFPDGISSRSNVDSSNAPTSGASENDKGKNSRVQDKSSETNSLQAETSDGSLQTSK